MENSKVSATASACALVLALVACSCGDDDVTVTQGAVFENVTVVNTRDGALAAGMSVVVDGARIVKIAPSDQVRIVGSAQAIDASGKYMVPGYLDMHTHAIDAADSQTTFWPLLIANGITGVREMRGSAALVQRAQQLNTDSAAGRIDAPEIVAIPGEIFGGEIVGQPPIAGATSASAAIAEVQKQKGYGAGFIKSVRATRDATLALLAEAKSQGLTVAGHFSPTVGAKESSDAGWKAVEHLGAGLTMLLDCSADEDSLRASLLSGTPATALQQPILDSYDDAKCRSLAQTFARNGTWHVPTLLRLRTILATDDPLYANDPNLVYVSKTTRAAWAGIAAAYSRANDAASAARLRAYYDKAQTLIPLMTQSGVKLMGGSDTAALAVWVIPGFSLHQEFALLAAAGLSPLAILQTTTLDAAEFLGRGATMGTVDEGKNADLVLLDANPVASAANLSRIWGVVMKGKYFPTAALDKLKSDVAAAHAAQAVNPAAVAAASHEAHTD